MTGEQFFELYKNIELRQYIVEQARRRKCRKDEDMADHIQEAWLCISCAPYGKTTEWYQDLANRAIRSSYWQLNKERLLQEHY